MALEKTLAREIRKEAPDWYSNRQAAREFLWKIRAARADMSCPDVQDQFDAMLRKHGRAVTAIVLAATLWRRQDRIGGWKLGWAMDVIGCWPHREDQLDYAVIDDGLHPTKIVEYAGSFIRLNEER